MSNGGTPRNRSAVLPPVVDLSVPSIARVYDYMLGGKDNYAVDRAVGDAMEQKFPGIAQLAVDNRQFLQRGVRFLAETAVGIRQFIEIGSGFPSAGNVHDIAHTVDPQARVVYVDRDPIVLAHARALIADNHTTVVIQADAADPDAILDHPVTRRFIDLDKPYAVLLVGLLHWLSDAQDPVKVAQVFTDRMPAGSYLLASALLDDDDPRAQEVERELVGQLGAGWLRPWAQQREYFAGLEMVAPGLVYANDWRPDDRTPRDSAWHTFLTGGAGRKE